MARAECLCLDNVITTRAYGRASMSATTCQKLDDPSAAEPHILISRHAAQRMASRGISAEAVATVLDYGRSVYTRGARLYALGRNEVERFARCGLRLERFEGTWVVCSLEGKVITCYKNRDFRGLRDRR